MPDLRMSITLNHHRPCLFATKRRDVKGRPREHDRDIATPARSSNRCPMPHAGPSPERPSSSSGVRWAYPVSVDSLGLSSPVLL